jgi:cytochrome c peroxidase
MDRFAFRTPSLRNAELTPPYMHDGVFETLEQVIEFYNEGCRPRHPSVTDDMLDPALAQPLDLSTEEVDDLVSFLRALTDPGTGLDPFLLSVPERVPSGLPPVFGVRALPAHVRGAAAEPATGLSAR